METVKYVGKVVLGTVVSAVTYFAIADVYTKYKFDETAKIELKGKLAKLNPFSK